MAVLTKNKLLRDLTFDYLSTISPASPPTPDEIEEQLIEKCNQEIEMRNAVSPKDNKFYKIQKLDNTQIAIIIAYLHNIIRVNTVDSDDNVDPELFPLAIYQPSGDDEGIYDTRPSEIEKVAWKYDFTMRTSDFKEILSVLSRITPIVKRTIDPDLIAVNNGVFNYKTKELLAFSPDFVFLTKSHVNYNPNATNVNIHNDEDNTDWDVESWLNELSDDPEIVQLLWEILGAIIRPNVAWDKSAWLYSEEGSNGKGTLCSLMRNLCGPGTHTSIPIDAFSKDFMLGSLVRASAIIVDENNVGAFIDKAAELKAIITNDIITVNRKHKSPISIKFRGFMVQCLNSLPKIYDKSNSLYRRQLFIPMEKKFEGRERKYIKHDYLKRTEVLEYVLYKLLNSNYYELSSPASCQLILDEYKSFNDPIRQFMEDIEMQLQWDVVPFKFLYELYKKWLSENIPHSAALGRNKFINELKSIVNSSSVMWIIPDIKKRYRVGQKMSNPEPLIAEYELKSYYSKTYKGDDIYKKCITTAPDFVSGMIKRFIQFDDDDELQIIEDQTDNEQQDNNET